MFRHDLTKDQYLQLLSEMSEEDFARYRYCQEMAGTFLAVSSFENALITAMLMCDRVKVASVIGSDFNKFFSKKHDTLHGSTLGNLIRTLERHCINIDDINYLKWVKRKRDYFVHRLFHDGAWPGDLDSDSCQFMTRRLLAIQMWLGRAEQKIWAIFKRAGFVEIDQLEDGVLVTNLGIYDD